MRHTFAVGLLTVILVAPVVGAQVVVDEAIEAAVGDLVSGEEGVDTGRAFRRIESRPGGKVGAVYRLVEIAGSTDPARGARAKWAVWCVAGPDGYHAVFDRVQRWERAEEVVRQVGGLVRWSGIGFPFAIDPGVRSEAFQQFVLAAVGEEGGTVPGSREAPRSLALTLAVEASMRDPVWHAAAVRMAAEGGPQDAGYVPALLGGLTSDDAAKRARAEELAGVLITPDRPEVVEGLVVCAAWGDSPLAAEILASFPESARWAAIRRLIRLRGARPREATAALARLGVVDVDVAQLAVEVAPTDAAAARTLLGAAGQIAPSVESEEVRGALEPLLERDDPQLRIAAARLLGRDDVLVRERVPELLRALRSDDPEARCRAANGIHLAGVFDARVTAALVRATERRDLAAREGLTLAVERGWAAKREPIEVLRELAGREGGGREVVYARAALRWVGER